MYIPKHWHWVGPVLLVLIGFYIRQHFGAYWDVFILVQLPLALIASEWGAYIWQAGVAYQIYLTGTHKAEFKKAVRDDTEDPTDGLLPVNRVLIQAGNPVYAQAIELPKFSQERQFAIDVLRMYDFDPHTQKFVDVTEKRWVIQKKRFTQKPFANMKKKWEHFKLLERENENKNARFIVKSRAAIAMVASGNPLPEWSPPLPE